MNGIKSITRLIDSKFFKDEKARVLDITIYCEEKGGGSHFQMSTCWAKEDEPNAGLNEGNLEELHDFILNESAPCMYSFQLLCISHSKDTDENKKQRAIDILNEHKFESLKKISNEDAISCVESLLDIYKSDEDIDNKTAQCLEYFFKDLY